MTIAGSAQRVAEHLVTKLPTRRLDHLTPRERLNLGQDEQGELWASLSAGERQWIRLCGDVDNLYAAVGVDDVLRDQLGHALVELGSLLVFTTEADHADNVIDMLADRRAEIAGQA
jgi:hypothetical protein